MPDERRASVRPRGVRVERGNDVGAAERILATLPEWFGIPEANGRYVEAAGAMPSYLAIRDGQVVGVLLVPRHFPVSAEVYLVAVDAAHRNSGVGSALLDAAEADLVADGVRWLQVKTLGPSRENANYAATRKFYAARGFQPLEELQELWDQDPCLIMIKTLTGPDPASAPNRSPMS